MAQWAQLCPGFVTAQVLDDDLECALGVLEFPLCQILPCADLTLEQRFQLDHSGLDSLISMRLVLRVNVCFLSVCVCVLGVSGAGVEQVSALSIC